MKKYVQLNYEERVTIKIMLQQGYGIQAIAKHPGRSPSTISREIKRGITVDGTDFADSTERQLRQRKLNDKRKRKMNNPIIYDYAACRLKNNPLQLSKEILKEMIQYFLAAVQNLLY